MDYQAVIEDGSRQPMHIDARTECAAALIERGDPDEGIRELVELLRLDPSSDDAHSMMARAYRDKMAWTQALGEADRAIAIRRRLPRVRCRNERAGCRIPGIREIFSRHERCGGLG
jgi:Tfp pilus assembly protein PilF